MKPVLVWFSAFVISSVAAASATAAPQIYFAENLAPNGTVTGTPVAARASFLSNLIGVGSEGFESEAPNMKIDKVDVLFNGSAGGTITATLKGGSFGVVDATFDTPDLGRFNTTSGGKQWWLSAGPFTIEFSAPVSAFGFYGTDIGDFNGRLTIDLLDAGGNTTQQTVDNQLNGPNGSLLFWGFIDPTIKYTKVTFGNTAQSLDGFGFDDMIVGDLGQIKPPNGVPEPVSLALVGTALLGVAAVRRRRVTT